MRRGCTRGPCATASAPPPHPRVAAAASLPPEAQDAAEVEARKDILADARAKHDIGDAPPADEASVKRDDDALARLLGSM